MVLPSVFAAAYDTTLDSPVGRLALRVRNGHLVGIDFLGTVPATRADGPVDAGTAVVGVDPITVQAIVQLRRYFSDPRAGFSLPLATPGTSFQRLVWQALQGIPVGETLSYGELASRLGSSARAVGGACRANPLPIVVPCHRVVARAGTGGFGGATAGPKLRIKQWLLAHERRS